LLAFASYHPLTVVAPDIMSLRQIRETDSGSNFLLADKMLGRKKRRQVSTTVSEYLQVEDNFVGLLLISIMYLQIWILPSWCKELPVRRSVTLLPLPTMMEPREESVLHNILLAGFDNFIIVNMLTFQVSWSRTKETDKFGRDVIIK
jgi:hypothetical protein